jgi:hypothetical protein
VAEKSCRCGGTGFEWFLGLDGEAEKDVCVEPGCPFWLEVEKKQKSAGGSDV